MTCFLATAYVLLTVLCADITELVLLSVFIPGRIIIPVKSHKEAIRNDCGARTAVLTVTMGVGWGGWGGGGVVSGSVSQNSPNSWQALSQQLDTSLL